jgi:hypothetical protein
MGFTPVMRPAACGQKFSEITACHLLLARSERPPYGARLDQINVERCKMSSLNWKTEKLFDDAKESISSSGAFSPEQTLALLALIDGLRKAIEQEIRSLPIHYH